MSFNQLKTYSLLFVGMAIFGSGTPTSKLVTSSFPLFLASGTRILVAAIILSLLALPARERLAGLQRKD